MNETQLRTFDKQLRDIRKDFKQKFQSMTIELCEKYPTNQFSISIPLILYFYSIQG